MNRRKIRWSRWAGWRRWRTPHCRRNNVVLAFHGVHKKHVVLGGDAGTPKKLLRLNTNYLEQR